MVSRRISAFCGIGALVVLYGSVVAASVVSPSFDWTANAVSDLGAVGAERAWILNNGLVVGSILLLPFVAGVFEDAENSLERGGAVVLGIVGVLSGLVGVFPHGTSLHAPVALGFFALYPVGLLVYGTGNVRRGRVRLGAITFGLVVAYLLVLGGWAVLFAPSYPGIAIPEFAGGSVLDLWVLVTAVRFVRSENPDGSRGSN